MMIFPKLDVGISVQTYGPSRMFFDSSRMLLTISVRTVISHNDNVLPVNCKLVDYFIHVFHCKGDKEISKLMFFL